VILVLLSILLILNPYTLIGPIGYFVALPLFGLAALFGRKDISRKIFYCFLILIFISFVGLFSSALHGITQIEHVKVAVSILVYYFVGVGLFISFKKQVDVEDFLLSSLYVGVLNGAVILLQVQIPQFRALVEFAFVASGNIDWTEGFRYRGLASGGGASLSALSAFMVYICLYLYGVKKIGAIMAATSLTILVTSVFFIGRTGVLLIIAAFVLYTLVLGWKNVKSIAFTAGLVIFFLFFGLDYIKEFLIQEYGEGFYTYSLGFFLEGRQGIEDEGTVSIISEFLTIVPKQFPEILIGYGFYGGSDFYPWTDSGYARMFLSVGFVFGSIFYGCAFYIFRRSAFGKQALFWPLIALLAIAETKEGMMFAGYSSRLLFILMGFWAAQKLHSHRQARKTISSAAIPNLT
jgi:hypothetical protein